MKYLVTGHTGFKGSWLTLLLTARGHEVSGIALDPPDGGLFRRAGIASTLTDDVRLDIRAAGAVAQEIRRIDPDVVLHLAAQPLVRLSYKDPRLTFETNVDGTLNVLDALRGSRVRATVIVTTDKVYRNVGQESGYVESDPLGGVDPYSASKAMADLLTQAWIASFPEIPTSIARAGNVIGGGDVSADRLIVDLMHGFHAGRPVHLRYPEAVRPWQHVLDCLDGYLHLVDAVLRDDGQGAWNFGPDAESFQTVRQLADSAASSWGPGATWVDDSGDHPHEAAFLTLDSSRAKDRLGWRNVLDFETSVEWTVDWYRSVARGQDAREATSRQIAEFEERRSTAAAK